MEKKTATDKGEFIMLAVHSKAAFVMSLEHKKESEALANKNHLNFLKKMKELEMQKNEGVGSPDKER